MPWFPDFVSAVELARSEQRAAGRSDPVAQYVHALNDGAAGVLEGAWPGRIEVLRPARRRHPGSPEAAQVHRTSAAWLAERQARIETIASTRVPRPGRGRTLAYLSGAEQSLAGRCRRRVG